MTKINEIKVQLAQFKENFQKEADHAISNGSPEAETHMYTLA